MADQPATTISPDSHRWCPVTKKFVVSDEKLDTIFAPPLEEIEKPEAPRPQTTNLDQKVIQVDSRQDFAKAGVLTDGTLWMTVLDGHGTNLVYDSYRFKSDQWWDDIMGDGDSIQRLRDSISELGDTSGSGASCSIVKISERGIDCTWVGDSQIRVYKNGTEIFASESHNRWNESEMRRMEVMGVKQSLTWDLDVLSPDTLTMTPATYFSFGTVTATGLDDKLNFTSSLGHNNNTGAVTGSRLIAVEPGDANSYRILIASDGLYDMICDSDTQFLAASQTSLTDIVSVARERWCQSWTYMHPPTGHSTAATTSTETIPRGDDIAAVLWNGHF